MEVIKEKLFRVKTIGGDYMETQLKRCLGTWDITLLGIGHMIGAGVYVLTGAVVRDTAGAGIVLSFLLAGFASLLSALCYAEFGARVPKAGSAYTYSYLTVGEFWAFTIGWNIILEHMLGAAAVARSFSGYLDTLLSHSISNGTVNALGSDMKYAVFLGDYPDLVALSIVLVVACFTAYGARTSTNVNNVFVVVNMFVILFVVVYGGSFADFDLWRPFNEAGHGFMPYGFGGVVAGAASCFFAYVGFDGLSSAAEEAINPSRSIPIATFVSMGVVTTAYVLMASALTLMVPFTAVHPTSAFADAFEQVGRPWAKYAVALGALSGMTTSLCGSMFALPRCVYAMASDGLLFKQLAHVHESTQVPIIAVAVFGSMSAGIALLFNIETLVEFLSIGTLLAYTIVSASVAILRYRPSKEMEPSGAAVIQTDEVEGDKSMLVTEDDDELVGRPKPFLAPLAPYIAHKRPGQVPTLCIGISVVLYFMIGLTFRWADDIGFGLSSVILLLVFALVTLVTIVLYGHHTSKRQLSFKVPFVPFLPLASIFINVFLMLHLSPITWVRLVVWLAVGYVIYFGYGIRHSKENRDASLTQASPHVPSYSALTEDAPHPDMSVQRVQQQ